MNKTQQRLKHSKVHQNEATVVISSLCYAFEYAPSGRKETPYICLSEKNMV